MLKKIRYKFIVIAMLTITIVTFGIFSIILIDTYARINKQGEKLIDVIIENNGKIPEYSEKSSSNATDFNKETRFQTRYFVVVTDDKNNIISTNTNYVASVTNDDAKAIIKEIQEKSKQNGFYKIYKYKKTKDVDGNNIIIFLDMAKEIGSFRELLYKGTIIVISGLIIVFVFVSFLSKKIIKPIEESIEKQKEFITDASHELKTPVAVILANIDVLEMTQDAKDNEWIESIKNQALRLDKLIKSLLKLSRLEELSKLDGKSPTSEKEIFSITQVIKDEINNFKALAKGKKISFDCQKDIEILANKMEIEQLITIFLDNAIKYSTENGEIKISANTKGKKLRIKFSNNCDNLNEINTDRLFDRFYRDDKSRNKKKEGYGIGLSVAKSFVDLYKGKIFVNKEKNNMICFTIILNNVVHSTKNCE